MLGMYSRFLPCRCGSLFYFLTPALCRTQTVMVRSGCENYFRIIHNQSVGVLSPKWHKLFVIESSSPCRMDVSSNSSTTLNWTLGKWFPSKIKSAEIYWQKQAAVHVSSVIVVLGSNHSYLFPVKLHVKVYRNKLLQFLI